MTRRRTDYSLGMAFGYMIELVLTRLRSHRQMISVGTWLVKVGSRVESVSSTTRFNPVRSANQAIAFDSNTEYHVAHEASRFPGIGEVAEAPAS